ncbi:alpha/beta hydrolase [Adhaeribacter aquaticus]|uniref:alpha/beta hydrolase n=1 Tax=Adhaeribacter aquaticus TaxID=299567 RepID=UPI00040D0203|nr:alpha/beta hydrolase [Adhaeribacter aquaticus]
MNKIFKILGAVVLLLIVFAFGAGFYFYQTNPMVKAIVNNDESKLYYFPVKEMESMKEMKYIENVLRVEDSLNIYTYHFIPPTKELKGDIFFIHGAGGNVSRYRHLIKPLLENGFRVYAVDWRGYGNSSGKPNYKGVLKDTETAFADFRKRTLQDSLKTIVYGMSLGGQLAVKITKDNQSEIDALVLDGSIQSAQQLAIDYAPVQFLKEKAKKNPADFNQDYVAIRDIQDIYNTPKLIIHSQSDHDVSFKQGENLFKAAKAPKEFWITKTEHIMTLKDHPDQTVQKINELIQ